MAMAIRQLRCSPIEALCDAVDAVAAESLDGQPDAVLGDDLKALRRCIDRLEAQFCRRTRRFEHSRGFAADGACSAVSWIRYRCRLSGAGAAQRAEIGRQMEHFADLEGAFTRGDIGYGHAAAIARTASEIGPKLTQEMAADLVGHARQLDPDRLRMVGRHLRHCVDPDGAQRDAEADHERRYLHVSQTFEGMYWLEGRLDAEGGAAVRTAIDALSMPTPRDSRTAAQRRADAMVELAHRQLSSGSLPARGGVKPHLTVTVPVSTMQHEPGSPGASMERAGCVPAETARRIACDAALTPVVVDADGQPLSVGRTRRTIPPAIRRALAVRDQGCRAEGCDRPIDWTEGHHVRHWVDHHGPTEVGNLLLLCRVHHRMAHELGDLRLRPLRPAGRPP